MIEVRQTKEYARWFLKLDDQKAKSRILVRVRRLQEFGQTGDAKSVGEGVMEMRVDYGPGYRLYFVNRDGAVVILLCGGTKSRQGNDIARAKLLAREV